MGIYIVIKINFQSLTTALIACLLGLATLNLSACGFALKGAAKPLPFTEVQLQSQANSYLSADISNRLQSRGVKLSTQPDAGVPRIALLDEARERNVLSTSATGGVRQFQLVHRVTVQLYDEAARTWLEPVVLSQTRTLDYNPSQLLAKELEEQTLYKDMQVELIAAIMRRLDASSTSAKPAALPASPK